MPECGGCTMCCKLLGIPELKKPVGKWCGHCAMGTGCKIYEDRPQSCREFECLYRTAPLTVKLPMTARPDKCKVVLAPTTNENVVTAHVDPGYPLAWEKEPVYGIIKAMVDSGVVVVISTGYGVNKLVLRRVAPGVVGRQTVVMSEPDENGMQWYDGAKLNA